MKTKTPGFFLVAIGIFLLASCSPRIVGTWTLQRYETTTPGEQGVSLSNIGTLHFNKNGTGEKDINYSVLGVKRSDQTDFKWTLQDGKYMVIESEGSDFAKTWIIMSNRGKYQKWQSTDGANRVQIIELKK